MNSLLTISSQVWVNGRTEPLTEGSRTKIIDANNELAQYGMRVLGVAFQLRTYAGTLYVAVLGLTYRISKKTN